ncbi:hypothetical protein [Bradyrhizobium sp. WSM1253]|nr:hypothetical protein [Bradyrhizobium sp. WSM1253]EIG63486.1 hypothetical protein Bra1253DRAFT_08461 [Bradyrhizobium sp. WSM1253]
MIYVLIVVIALGFVATVWAIMRIEKALLKQRDDAVNFPYVPLP